MLPEKPAASAVGVVTDSVTPGETFPGVTAAMVCSGDWATAHRQELTRAQKAAVLRAYGLPADTKVSEWDHRDSLSEAGTNSIRNIWPQIYADQKRRKDALEDKVHAAVCSGRLTLAQGQHEVADFWIYW